MIEAPAADTSTRRAAVARKIAALRDVLDRRGFGAAALTARRNFAWLTDGGDAHVDRASGDAVAAIVVTRRDAFVLTTTIERDRLATEELDGTGLRVEEVPWPEGVEGGLRAGAAEMDRGRIARDGDLEIDLRHLRSRLSPEEEERLIWLGARAARAVTDAFLAARRGDLETVVGERVTLELASDAVSTPVLLIASDERIPRYRHPIPKPKPVENTLLLVLCAEWRGLWVALTRQGALAGRYDDESRHRFDASRAVENAMHEATVPGRTLGDILATGIAAYAAAGYPGEWRLHHQGGTIAYRGREVLATPGETERADPGMAFAWNPSITGAKVEDTLLLRGDGRRVFVTRDDSWPSDANGAPLLWDAR
jgi:antitoxin VapB